MSGLSREQLKDWHSSIYVPFSNFIANSLSAIAAYCFFKKKPAIDVKFVNDGQLAIFWFYFELTLIYL